jgi:hypothetical protein
MNKEMVLAFLDAEIQRLQQARELLAAGNVRDHRTRAFRLSGLGGTRRRRHMSAEARRRISEAQKKRWAARKRAAKQ